MPNTTGGKNYKKSKHSSGSYEPAFIDRQSDQMYARVIKVLGSLNMLVYCNDNKTRLCHVRGSMRKKVWINIGDIVLVSLREFEKDAEKSSKTYEKGDILAKYDISHMGKLKKLPDINQKLFMTLETTDGTVLAELGKREASGKLLTDDDCGIEFDYDAKDKNPEGVKEDLASESDSDKDVDIDDI
jgi:translation initiation factor 1A